MITLKLWNGLSQKSRSEICKILGVSGKVENEYHHNFDYDTLGGKVKAVLESCNLQKDGTVNVVVNVKPTKETAKKKVEQKKVEKEPERYCYIGYFYQYDDEGQCIDSFKEWCEAESIEEAKRYFQDDYRSCLDWLRNKGSFRKGITLEGMRVENQDGKAIKETWF